MKKIETLKKNYEFKYVLTKGKYYRGNYITIYIKKNTKKRNIIGIAVNTKIGKAVKRNRAKRLIRENYRLVKDELLHGYNIIFLLNKGIEIEDLSFIKVKMDMHNIFSRAELFEKVNI